MTFGKKKHAAGDPAAEKTKDAAEAAPQQETAAPAPAAATDASAVADAAVPQMPSSEPAAPVEPAPSQPSEADVLKDRLLRLQADFDNFRKRMARERQETIARANEDLLEALLTPVDHLDRALDVMQKGVAESDPCLQGVRLVRSELRAVLDRFGLKPIETQGKPFDPSIHESLGWASVAGVAEGHVAAEVRAGYLLNGRLLRAAQVMVGAAPAALPANDTTAAPDESAEG